MATTVVVYEVTILTVALVTSEIVRVTVAWTVVVVVDLAAGTVTVAVSMNGSMLKFEAGVDSELVLGVE